MAMEPTTASSSATTDYDPEEEIDHHLAEEALTNKALLQMIFKYHDEVRLRLVVVRTDRDTDGSTQTADIDNHIVGSAFEAISMEHGQAYHTVVDRDHRPHRALVEQLITPQRGPQPLPRQHSDTTQCAGGHTTHKSPTSTTLSN